MGKRQDAALETRRRLLETGKALITKRGFSNVSVEDITEACGVAKGTFYIYFHRKEDLIRELSRQTFVDIARALDRMEGADILEKLTFYVDRFIDGVQEGGIQICREWIRSVIDPNNVWEGRDGEKWLYDTEMLRSFLKKAVAAGELRSSLPVELMTQILISQLYGMMTCWCMSDGAFDPKDWTNRFCKAQLEPILAPYLPEGPMNAG